MTTKAERVSPGAAPITDAPPADQALPALAARTARTFVFLFVRLAAVALLVTLLQARLPWVQDHRTLVDGIAALLVVLPFFTALGRGFAWRIALGRAYVREERWAEAERTLAPFNRRSYHPFDAAGEGAYWLALTHRALNRPDEARALLEFVARSGRGEWRDRAAATHR